MGAPVILVFDSGVGGLTVHAEIRELLPDALYVYVADDAAFPYGRLSEDACIGRVAHVVGLAVDRFRPDIAVIACNTASTVALPALRSAHAVPFVGTVPAVKPAAALSQSKMIAVLGTPGTVRREYTYDLIIRFAADCRVDLVGAQNLARLAESHLRGEEVSDAAVLDEILPCFREKDGQRTDAIVLACTHYPLLMSVYRRVAPWEVTWVDPAPAIARRVVSLLSGAEGASGGQRDPLSGSAVTSESIACFTSGKPEASSAERVMLARGFQVSRDLTVPFDAALPARASI